ncbi:hypothetical protein L226DRAFT_514965 [Lentinus tigrinus ALCF2SS1-7]|uniref:Fe2OG dioxygenase domain-containing protein n=1 Tax=Lentinus tigrinus ALCF2SS1-6 TaxID=1328759 RepID=A0A5C2RTR2_9APHY|nr:hypothetical protein L227DRAFT_511560 [Lentinus tigrinus ALCF2SS1-6]RPD69998.1 hypothetical protein L226DRAFT_514965 [Lentinus tigrinus ALCF2SS1-7]
MRSTPRFTRYPTPFTHDTLLRRYINLSTSSIESLDALESACEAATFGRNQETVLDESYRKAGKMDTDKFSLPFDAEKSGLIDVVKTGLLIGKEERKDVRAELYKLNVYGKDAFFKPHKDTPRGTDMFGSLVVVFPTPHEGGALILRHEGKEWTFDAAQVLASSPSKRIAYVAFFSDVEHEVIRVLSGHRVTITYNMYWAGPPRVAPPPGLSVLHPLHESPSEVGSILSALFADPAFLPDGGTLGFGLRHAYPFPSVWDESMEDPLVTLQRWLKGGDAALFQAIKALSLEPLLRLLFQSYDYRPLVIMMDHMIELGHTDTCEEYLLLEQGGVGLVAKHFGPPPKVRDPWYSGRDKHGPRATETVDVHWINECEKWNRVRSEYVAYGNEASTEYLYMNIALLVDVGPAGNRTDISAVHGVHSPRIVDEDEEDEEDDEEEED